MGERSNAIEFRVVAVMVQGIGDGDAVALVLMSKTRVVARVAVIIRANAREIEKDTSR